VAGGVVVAGAAAVFRWCDILNICMMSCFSDFRAVRPVSGGASGRCSQAETLRRFPSAAASAAEAGRSNPRPSFRAAASPKLQFNFRQNRQKAARSVSGVLAVTLTL